MRSRRSSIGKKQYIQVCYLLASEDTIQREFGALAALPDNYPKTVLSMDPLGPDNREGILWKNVIAFLMEGAAPDLMQQPKPRK